MAALADHVLHEGILHVRYLRDFLFGFNLSSRLPAGLLLSHLFTISVDERFQRVSDGGGRLDGRCASEIFRVLDIFGLGWIMVR